MEITLCSGKYQDNFSCGIDITILTICCIVFIVNLYAAYAMSNSLRRIKFENLVIFCGVMQSVLLIFIIITNLELLILLILFCQVLIYLFILRRFSRIYFRMKRCSYEAKTNCYNLLFYLNAIINIALTISFIVVGAISPEGELEIVIAIQWMHSLYSLAISLVLFYIGINVRRLLLQSVIESDNCSFAYYIGENLKKEDFLTKSVIMNREMKDHVEFKETYFKVRRLQIDLIIYISLLSGIYQASYLFMKNTLLYDQFDNTGFKSIPISKLSYVMHIIYLSCSILTIIINFFAFFYIIRSSYQISPPKSRTSLNYFRNESFIRISQNTDNKDIDMFIDKL